jgi:P-loop Domain of unknown function (DUF2791)
MKMDQEQCTCRSIVHALKRGLVPARGLEHIAVGRESELQQVRRDLAFSKSGGGWVRFVSGDYGTGKTFLCSLVREVAWHEGFVVAALDLGRDAPLHKFEVIYQSILDGMGTDYFRDVPAFEFLTQEWLFNLEQDAQGSTGLDPADPQQRGEIALREPLLLNGQDGTGRVRPLRPSV